MKRITVTNHGTNFFFKRNVTVGVTLTHLRGAAVTQETKKIKMKQ